MIAGAGAYICDGCVEVGSQIVEKVAFPELAFINRWENAIKNKDFGEAISISEQGYKLAKKVIRQRSSGIFIKLFQRLRQIAKSCETKGIKSSEQEMICSFCGKNRSEVKDMVTSATVFICGGCIEISIPSPISNLA